MAYELTVTPVNDLPTRTNATGSINAGTTLAGKVTCSDPDGDALVFTAVDLPTNGTVSAVAANGSFTYTPDGGFFGTDAFTVTAEDGKGGTATSTWTVTVKKVLVGPPTNADQCKNDGWKTFNNPTFGNQGSCVSYVARPR